MFDCIYDDLLDAKDKKAGKKRKPLFLENKYENRT